MGWISDILGGGDVDDTTAHEQGNEPGDDNVGSDK